MSQLQASWRLFSILKYTLPVETVNHQNDSSAIGSLGPGKVIFCGSKTVFSDPLVRLESSLSNDNEGS
jgi:hypothetical protein